MNSVNACVLESNNDVLRYIEKKGWNFSGTYPKEKNCGVVVVPSLRYALDDMESFPNFLTELFEKNIEIAIAEEDLVSLRERNLFLIKVLEYSSRKGRGEEIKKGLERRVKKGKYPGFPPPYGYKFKNGKLIVERKEFWHVKKIFSLYRSGKSLSEVARALNMREIPTKKGKKWKKQTVAKILSNPIYCGYLKWNNLLVKSTHKPIITEEEYEEALSKLKGPSYRPQVNDGFNFQSLKYV